MKISEKLQEKFQCLVDSNNGVVRIFANLPDDKRTLNAVKKQFPNMENCGSFFRLGGYGSFSNALRSFTVAKTGKSSVCKKLHFVLIDDSAISQHLDQSK